MVAFEWKPLYLPCDYLSTPYHAHYMLLFFMSMYTFKTVTTLHKGFKSGKQTSKQEKTKPDKVSMNAIKNRKREFYKLFYDAAAAVGFSVSYDWIYFNWWWWFVCLCHPFISLQTLSFTCELSVPLSMHVCLLWHGFSYTEKIYYGNEIKKQKSN